MFRVLLPTGELTLSTRIEFLKGAFNKEKGRLELSRLEIASFQFSNASVYVTDNINFISDFSTEFISKI